MVAFLLAQKLTNFGSVDNYLNFEFMHITVEKILIDRSIKIEMYPSTEDMCKEYNILPGYLIVDVFTKNNRQLIPVHPKIVEHCLDVTIDSLLLDEEYELCSVLRDLKTEYILLKNDY